MNFSLTPELESFVQERVDSGLYGSASEVVRDGLRLLRERVRAERRQLVAEFNQFIDQGLASADDAPVISGDASQQDPLPDCKKSGVGVNSYELTEQAQQDIDELIDFIALRKNNPDGAEVVLDYLYAAMQDLADNPNLGHFRRDLTDRPVKFYRRDKQHKYYLVFEPETVPLRIVRVAGVNRDFLNLLNAPPR